VIRVRSLSKSFGTLQAVKELSFDIIEGEVVGLLGPNGAGKSTTIKMLTGYLTPSNGTVEVADMDLSRELPAIRKRIGYMPQDIPLYEDMIVLDYLRFIADIRQIPPAKRDGKIKEVAERCSIEKVVTQSIGTLSSGYKQRVGLAQALIHNPDILILDEPTSDLDPNQIVEIRNLIKEIGREKTVIVSSHILSEVQATCGRVMIISEGKLVADGSPGDLLAQERRDQIVHVTLQDAGVEAGLAAIRQLDSTSGVQAGEDGRFVVESKKGCDVRPELFHMAVAHQWVILEMRAEQVSLEDVFRKLTMN
jgi:ABC-2 type transport system ATP-binding protein